MVDDEKRLGFLKLIVEFGYKIIRAARASGIKYENAKLIYRKYVKENRILKFKNCRTRDYGLSKTFTNNEPFLGTGFLPTFRSIFPE